MPLIPNGHLFATYFFRLTGDPDPMVTTLGHEWNSGSQPITTAASTLRSTYETHMISRLIDDYTFEGVRVIGRPTGGGALQDAESFVDVAGTRVADPAPSNVAALVHKRTNVAGRRNRGRMYLPGYNTQTGMTALGVRSAADQSALQLAIDGWLAALIAIENEPVILHNEAPDTATPVTELELDPVVATQRRRLR